MVINTFDKDKIGNLIEVYEGIFEEGNRNIFNFNDFLIDSGISAWNKEYIEFMFYYFNDKQLFDGITSVLYHSNTLYAIKFLEPFALKLFDEVKDLKFSKNENFLDGLPCLEKVGYIDSPYMFYLEYFKDKYSTEKGVKMIEAEFSREYFIPKIESDDNNNNNNNNNNLVYPTEQENVLDIDRMREIMDKTSYGYDISYGGSGDIRYDSLRRDYNRANNSRDGYIW